MERDKAKPSTIKLPETNRASFSSKTSVKTPKEKNTKEEIDASQLSNSLIKTETTVATPTVGTPNTTKPVENKMPLQNVPNVSIPESGKNETSNEKVQTPISQESSFVVPPTNNPPCATRLGSNTPSSASNAAVTYSFNSPNPNITASPNASVSSARFSKKKENPPASPNASIPKDNPRTIKTSSSPKAVIKSKLDKQEKPKKKVSPQMSLDSPEKDASVKTNPLNTSHDNTLDNDSLGHSAVSQPSAKQSTNEFVNYYKQERPKINIWTYLFKNLNNSISQIYTMCDLESSVEFNNGVVSTLEAAIEDIKKLNKKIELDNMTDTKPIAWEVPSIAKEIENKQEIENFLEDVENPDTVDFTLLTQLIQDGKMSRQDALVLLVRERALLLDDSTLNMMNNNSQGMMSDNISVVSKINPDFSLEYHKDSKDNKDGKEESIGTPFQIIDEGQDLLRRSRSQTPGRISLVKVINRLNWKLQDKKREVDEGYASEEYVTEEHKNKLTEKQQRAEMNRKERENIKQDSLQKEFHKINEAREKVAQQQVKKLEAISKKIGEAEERYEAKLTEKKKKAKNEIDKVNEVAFISFLEKQNKKLTFDQKLQETRERRLNIIEQIKQKQMGRSIKEDAASKRRAALQKETEGKLKSKLEEAEHRRNKIFEEKKKVLGEESKKLVDVTNRKKILGFKETPLKKGEEQTFKARLEHLKIILLEEQQKLNKRLAKKDNSANETVKRGRKLSVAALSSEEDDSSFVRPKRVRSVRSEDAEDEDGDITMGAHSILFYEPRSKRKEKATQEEENKAIAASREKAAAAKKGKKKKPKKKDVDIAPKKEDDDKMKTVYVLIRSFSQPNMRTPKLRDLQLKVEVSDEKKGVQKGQKVMTPSNASAVKKPEKVESTPKAVKEKEKDGSTAKKFSINKAKSIGSSSSAEPMHTSSTADGGRSGRGAGGSQTSVTGRKERTSITEKDDHSLDLDSSLQAVTSGRGDKEKEKELTQHGSMLLEKIYEQSDNDENLGQTNSMSEEKEITEEGKEDANTSSENDKKVRWCSICDLILEVNAGNDEHIGSKQHRKVKLQYNLSSSDDTNCILEFKTSDLGSKLKTERWNTLKKRCKKIKQRLVTRALKKESSYLAGKEVTSINKQRLQKLSQDLDKQVATQIKDYDVVDNTLKDILKLLENQKEADLHIMRQLKFIPILMEICKRVSVCHKNEMDALLRALDSAIKILAKFCGLIDNRTYMILSNRLVPLVDLLIWCLNRPTKFVYSLTFVPHLFTILGRHLNHRLHIENAGFKEDIIEYIFCSGLIMKLQQKFMSFNGGLDLTTSMGKVPLALLKSVSFLEILTNVVDVDFNTDRGIFDPPIVSENIMIALKETEFVGMFTLLASLLLSDGSYIKQPSKVLPQTVLSVAMTTVKFFNNIARIMLEPFQSLLGNKEHQEQVCHVFGYLLTYCNHHYDSSEDVKDLLDELILMIGYFCVLNPINQEILGKGMMPIIQKLTALPIPYFTDKRMKDVLFPTLFCAVFQNERNLGIVDQEASKDYLEKYLQSQIQLFPLECINEKEEGHLTPSNHDSGLGLNPFGVQNRSNKPKEMKYIRALSVSSNTSSTTSLFNVNASNSYNFHLICRFPRNRWDELLQFIHSV